MPPSKLLCNENDIKKAVRQADLAKRLEERGISPYARFMELNESAHNIARSADRRRPRRTPY